MNEPHDGRVVVITGASRGLGRAIALRCGGAGCKVVINYLNRGQEAADVANEINRDGGEAVVCRADVRNPADADSLVASAVRQWGSVDVLVNNAGITRDGLLIRMAEQDWDAVLGSNLTGPFHCIRSAADIMTRQRSGHIINIASLVGLRGRDGQANYAASKAGLIGLTKACAVEFGRFNIKVNAVLPGYLVTDMGKTVSSAMHQRIIQENALARAADPKETAEFVYRLSLMNDVSGQVFNLDSRIV